MVRGSLVLLGTVLVGWAAARSWHVPGDLPTLQEALWVCQDGDSILAEAGEHRGPLDFLGRAVWLGGRAGAENTRLVADAEGPLVRFQHGEGPASVLEGFTLDGGQAPFEAGVCGGALRIEGASPTIRACVVRGGAAVLGGGACLLESGAWLEGNRFEDNEAEMGGAVYARGGEPVLMDNVFVGNRAEGAGYGGAVALDQCPARLERDQFVGNRARLGGALCWRGSGGLALRLSAWGDSAALGGGLYLYDSAPAVGALALAGAAGGALLCNGGGPTLSCCVVDDPGGLAAFCGVDGGGNRAEDPLFCAPEEGDLRLRTGSPCWSSACGPVGAMAVDCQGAGLERPVRPAGPWLAEAVPNPFNPSTRLAFTLDRPGPVDLAVYDLAGRRLAELVCGDLPAGRHERVLDARGWSSGLYLACLEADGRRATRKLLLVR